MIKYTKIIFFQKICIKNGMCPIHRCVLYAEKYGNLKMEFVVFCHALCFTM